jgi:NitT/TauT family transport system ATP-binding protein
MTVTTAGTPQTRTTRTALRFDGVHKQFANGTTALADVNLTVAAGEFVAVVGPSGCGKSTLLRLASGLDQPTGGSIAVAGASLGYVFQDPTLLPWRRVLANVELPAELAGVSKGERRARAKEVLRLVGLEGAEKQLPRQLSGGMKMRVSLARALVTHPRILLLDEPFAALDEITRFKLNDDLLRLWRVQGWTVIFVTHSVYESVFLSQRVVVMSPRPGRISADIPIDLPQPRAAELRASAAYGAISQTVSERLAQAMAA